MKKNKKLKRFVAIYIDLTVVTFIVYIISLIKMDFTSFFNLEIDPLLFFGVIYLYFIASELLFDATIGKKIMKMKVTFNGSYLVRLFKIILRNLFIVLELILPIIYIIPILFFNKKLGDYLSKSNIVYD